MVEKTLVRFYRKVRGQFITPRNARPVAFHFAPAHACRKLGGPLQGRMMVRLDPVPKQTGGAE